MRRHGGGFSIILDAPSCGHHLPGTTATAYWWDGTKPVVSNFAFVPGAERELAFTPLRMIDAEAEPEVLAALRSGEEWKPYCRIGPKTEEGRWAGVDWLEIGKCLTDVTDTSVKPDAECIPAAYTYFGQFIAHELSNVADIQARGNRVIAVSAKFDLESLFAVTEPAEHPNSIWYAGVGVGRTATTSIAVPDAQRYNDLPRTPEGASTIGDSRNDQNLGVAQIHVMLSRFHQASAMKNGDSIDVTQAKTRVAIQEVVLFDYLKRISDPAVYCDIMRNGRQLIRPGVFDSSQPFLIPIEFAAACFRIGHSMVRDEYMAWHSPGHNVTLSRLQSLTYPGKDIGGTVKMLEHRWTADWDNLLGYEDSSKTFLNHAKAIDRFLNSGFRSISKTPWFSPSVHQFEPAGRTLNLAGVTLRRGVEYHLPSAQALSAAVKVSSSSVLLPVLGSDQLLDGRFPEHADPTGLTAMMRQHDLADATPLWLYCLLESEVIHEGQCLGPFATRIVAETIHASIEASASGLIDKGCVSDFDVNTCLPTRPMHSLHDVASVAKQWVPP